MMSKEASKIKISIAPDAGERRGDYFVNVHVTFVYCLSTVHICTSGLRKAYLIRELRA